MTARYGISDYPLAETAPDEIRGQRGKTIADITLEGVLSGEVTMADLRITPSALRAQADIARDAKRPTLGQNFERAAELVSVPQDVVMRVYELLRPGRARTGAELLAAAAQLREEFGAPRMADFIEEAAGIYEARGLFSKRY
jgi:propanediol dehydratase small subunit